MKTDKTRLAAAALLALSLAVPGSAQAKKDKPGAAIPTAASAPMPKTDRMPMAEFKKLLAEGGVVVIDVRSNDAYLGGHIPGALSMPEITDATALKLKQMGKPIATYCS